MPDIIKRIRSLTPFQTDFIKTIAFFLMLIDHLNRVFLHPISPIFYSLGRGAFPLFAVIWGAHVGANPGKMDKRLWLWAFLSQPGFVLAFNIPWYHLNILFLFAVCSTALTLARQGTTTSKFLAGALVLSSVLPLAPESYGPWGVIFCFMTIAINSVPSGERGPFGFIVFWWLPLLLLNGAGSLLVSPLKILIFAVLPTVFIPYLCALLVTSYIPGQSRFLPRQVFYFVYAGHLLLLAPFSSSPLLN